MVGNMSDVTQLLEATGRGDREAQERLLELVYSDLHRMAEHRLAGDWDHHTVQPTALVNDAWLRLAGRDGKLGFANRAHFFSAAARAMRCILIDLARRKHACKRGGELERVDLDSVEVAETANSTTLLRIDEAVEKLAGEDPASAELVRLRFFVGMNLNEAAAVLGISERTAKRYWQFARAWLYDELRGQRGL